MVNKHFLNVSIKKKISKIKLRYVMSSMVTIVNTIVHIWKWLKETDLESSQHTKKLWLRWWMLNRLTVVISIYKYQIVICTPETNIICELYPKKLN